MWATTAMSISQAALATAFLTEDEVSGLINRKQLLVEEPPERRAAERRDYRCFRAVADCDPESKSSGVYYHVHCRDISTRGIGFLSPKRPVGDTLVLRLSPDGEPPLLIAAKIVFCQPDSGDPAFPFVVGCLFLERL
jgi:hypothetical protein